MAAEGVIVRDRLGFHDKSRCGCLRCRGFQPGNPGYGGGHPPTHGAYQTPIKLKASAERMAEKVRPLMPVYHPGFEGTLQTYCILLVRIERAHHALEEWEAKKGADDGDEVSPRRPYLHEDLRRWTASALKHATQLGLTPASAAAILRDAKGGDRDIFRPPSQEELERVPLDSLRRLQQALNEALDEAVIDA